MNNKPTVYDFPYGFPDYATLRSAAFDKLQTWSFLWSTADGPPSVRFDQLSVETIDQKGETHRCYPILELYLQGEITREEIKKLLLPLFRGRAYKALLRAAKQEADHIAGTFYLAWGIYHQIYSKWEISSIRFDHDDAGWNYLWENYVLAYGGDHIDTILDDITTAITSTESLEAWLQKWKQSWLLRERTNERMYEAFCCTDCP